MATESLIVELDAKTAKLDAKLRATERSLDELNGTTQKADSSLKKMGNTASVVGGVIVKTTTAAVALGAAIGAMTLKSASNRKELEQFARQAKTTEGNFQALAFSTSQFGVNAEQIADISKDVADRLGEFATAGTGTFQDYADVMKLTKEEAKAVAVEFQSLSSEEVIGRMVSNMEEAGATGNQMTFVLESMGNDLSKLQPLFANNSAELKTMKDRFDAVNGSLQITAGQAEKLKGVSTSFDLLTSSFGNAATAISATIAPVVDDFFNDIIDVVPDATQTIIDFVNSFLDAENITSIAAVNKEIVASQDQIAEKTELIANTNGRNQRVQRILLKEEQERLAALEAQLEVLKEQESVAEARRLEGGQIGGTVGAGVGSDSDISGTGDQIQAIADRFKSEEELLIEKLDRELALIGENNDLKLQLENEFLSNMADLDTESGSRKEKAAKKSFKSEEKIEGLRVSLASRTAQTLLSGSLSTEQKLFSIVKDSAAAAIEAYGLTAAAKDVATLGTIAGTPVGAKTIAWSQVAAGIVRSIPLGGGGGGGAPSGGSDGGSPPAQQAEIQQEEISTLNLSSQDEDSANVLTVRFATDSGDQLLDALAEGLNNNQRQGR